MPQSTRTRLILSVMLVTVGLNGLTPVFADVAVQLESAVLGAVGKFGGSSITPNQFIGWRFEIDRPLRVTEVGGHLLGLSPTGPNVIFAALVALESVDVFPRGDPFLPEEIVAVATFSPPFPSAEIFTPLAADLDPGAYALVYGTGLFGATDNGGMPNGTDQSDIAPTTIDSYIFYGIPFFNRPPLWRGPLASNMRFVIRGTAAPLQQQVPALGPLGLIALASLVASAGWLAQRRRAGR